MKIISANSRFSEENKTGECDGGLGERAYFRWEIGLSEQMTVDLRLE